MEKTGHNATSVDYFCYDTIYNDQEFAQCFKQYLEDYRCVEPFNFIMDVRQYKRLRQSLDTMSEDQSYRLLNSIMNQYIWWRSPQAIRIASTIKDRIINLHLRLGYNVPITIFDDAVASCHQQLKTERWKPFLCSQAFASFIKTKPIQKKPDFKRGLLRRWTVPCQFLRKTLSQEGDGKNFSLFSFTSCQDEEIVFDERFSR